jgi:hypothetical protein
MPSEPELEPVPPCLLPLNDPALEHEHYSGPGWGLGWIRAPFRRAGSSTTYARWNTMAIPLRHTWRASFAQRVTSVKHDGSS